MHGTSYFQPDGRIRCKWSIIEPWDRINIVTFSHHPSLIRRLETHTPSNIAIYPSVTLDSTSVNNKEDGLVAEGLYTTGSARILPTTPPAASAVASEVTTIQRI